MKFIKPKFWDKKEPSLISYLLIPFTILIKINNLIIEKNKKFKPKNIKSICVGNIYIGGTGKTPLTIKLHNIIKRIKKKTIVAKKFYSTHKDELELLKKYTKVLSGKNRIQLIKYAIKKKFKIVIFDDGLQDKKIDYDLKFVCFDSEAWVGNGKLLPSGPLRQELKVLKNFDAVFLKNIKKINIKAIRVIRSINPKIKVFNFNLIIKNKNKYDLSKKYLVVSGIGNSDSFINLLKYNKFKISNHIRFPDHHAYRGAEIKKIVNLAKLQKTKVLTTEKDYIKIPKEYLFYFKCLKVDLHINDHKKFVNFLKKKINE